MGSIAACTPRCKHETFLKLIEIFQDVNGPTWRECSHGPHNSAILLNMLKTGCYLKIWLIEIFLDENMGVLLCAVMGNIVKYILLQDGYSFKLTN